MTNVFFYEFECILKSFFLITNYQTYRQQKFTLYITKYFIIWGQFWICLDPWNWFKLEIIESSKKYQIVMLTQINNFFCLIESSFSFIIYNHRICHIAIIITIVIIDVSIISSSLWSLFSSPSSSSPSGPTWMPGEAERAGATNGLCLLPRCQSQILPPYLLWVTNWE